MKMKKRRRRWQWWTKKPYFGAAESIYLLKNFRCIKHYSQTTNLSKWWLLQHHKWTFDYRPLSFLPKLLTIALLLNLYENKSEKSIGQFWEKDILHELAWPTTTSFYFLKEHHSIVYVVFDSFILFDQSQFKDLRLGLDLTNMLFLWVLKGCARSKFKWTDGSSHLNKKVLGHHSVACFNRIAVGILPWNVCPMGYPFVLAIFCWQTFWHDMYLWWIESWVGIWQSWKWISVKRGVKKYLKHIRLINCLVVRT